MKPRSFRIKRSTAAQLGAMGLIAVGTAATGGTLAPLLIPALGTKMVDLLGGSAIGLVSNLVSNLFAGWSEDREDDARRRAQREQNHDLHRAITLAIARCLDELSRGLAPKSGDQRRLVKIAERLKADPLSLELSRGEDAIDEKAIAEVLSGNAEEVRSKRPLTAVQWEELVVRLSKAYRTPLGPGAAKSAAGHLETCFAATLVQTLKDLAADNDPAWIALVLRILGEIHGSAKDNSAALTELRRLFAEHAKAVEAAVGRLEVRAAGPALAGSESDRPGDSDQLHFIRTTLEALVTDVPAMRAALDRMGDVLTGIAADTKAAADFSKVAAHYAEAGVHLLREQLGGGRLRSVASFSDNLAQAGMPRNEAFVGRRKDLNRLVDLIQRPNGPSAVAIVAGAGFGKTELAREFLHAYTRSASPDADPVGLEPDEWTGRWWLDGSTQGEERSLKANYQAITGLSVPPEPPARQGEAPEATHNEFLVILRRSVARACSSGKQLVVLDNAMDAAQIRDYRPYNAGRLIATTRRQPIPPQVADLFPLDVLSLDNARELLTRSRSDLKERCHESTLDAIAVDLGYHALGLSYAAAALARPPFDPPQAVLKRIRSADVGEEDHLLNEFTEEDLGGISRRNLAGSLGALLDELESREGSHRDPLALALAELASFCNPEAIPIELLAASAGVGRDEAVSALRSLHARSIVQMDTAISIHRLTQSLLRGRVRRRGIEATSETLGRLLQALIDDFCVRDTVQEHQEQAALAHAEVVLEHVTALDLKTPEIEKRAARLHGELADGLLVLGRLASSVRHAAAAAQLETSRLNGSQRSVYAWEHLQSKVVEYRGAFPGAERDLDWSVEREHEQLPPDERSQAIWYGVRASLRHDRLDLLRAEQDIQRSIEWGERQSPRDEQTLTLLHAQRAIIRQDRGDLLRAEQDIQRSIEWLERQSPPDEQRLAMWHTWRATIRTDRSDFAGAEEDLQWSIEWLEHQSTHNEQRLLASLKSERGFIREALTRKAPGPQKRKIFDERYEIVSIVHRGHDHVMYVARRLFNDETDAWRTGRFASIAIKVRLERGSNSGITRNVAMAIVAARHHYVVRLYDFHSSGELAYIAMEFAPELDLRTYMRKMRGALSPLQGELFLLQAAEALNSTHQAGVLHCGIEPEHILVMSAHEIRLAGFGEAVSPGEKPSLDSLRSRLNAKYAAPEVLAGIGHDRRSDIYALGATFYEVLTGVNPFEHEPMNRQLEIRKDGVFPPIHTVRCDLPAYLAQVIMKAMRYDPAARFESGRAVAQALLSGAQDAHGGSNGSAYPADD
jgi:serine/threonine protein kinase